MFCKNCGNELKDNSKFCANCGVAVNSQSNGCTGEYVVTENAGKHSYSGEYQPHTSSIFGWQANTVAALSYWVSYLFAMIPVANAIAFLAPLFVLLAEKDSEFVKKHAKQSLVLNIATLIILVPFILVYIMIMINSTFNTAMSAINDGNIDVFLVSSIFSHISFVCIYGIIAITKFVIKIIGTMKAARYEDYTIPIIGRMFAK